MRGKFIVVCIIALSIFMGGCARQNQSSCKIMDLKVNYRDNPFNADKNPIFSWRMEDETQGQFQSAYRIVVGETKKALDNKKYVWDSGKVESDISVAVAYEGEELEQQKSYFWRVYVWDKDGKMTVSDEDAFFETGIFDDDWENAKWIGQKRLSSLASIKDKTSYEIEYDVVLGNTYTGFVWGAEESFYGNYYRTDINTLGEKAELNISEMDNDEILSGEKIIIPDSFGSIEKFRETLHHIKIAVSENKIAVYIDDIYVGEKLTDNYRPVGGIGLWVTRGSYYALYDNILITANGNKMYDEKFDSNEKNIFSPYYIKTKGGWCEASSGYIMTPSGECPAPMLRKQFKTDTGKKIESARLYASALGIYDIYVNGNDICDNYMAPGRSAYSEEAYYETYDITQYLTDDSLDSSENVIGVILGHGRYNRAKVNWGSNLALCASIVIKYSDGSRQVITTDETWKIFDDGPIRNDDMFAGEHYDANYEIEHWSEKGFDDSSWQTAAVFDEYNSIKKIPLMSEPVRCMEELSPILAAQPLEGVYVYDFGQNFNGNCKITLRNMEEKSGQTVTIRYAEKLNEENMSCKDDEVGTIWTQNLYTADNTDYYTIAGRETEIYTPTFVCRGFRYVQITGIDKEISKDDIKGLVISAEHERTGHFECSDENINKLYNSIYWTQLSNYTDIPTDCPQRDERFGWAGDAQVFTHTADYNANIYNFIDKYINMMRTGQGENGAFPEIAPSISKDTHTSANGWGDAGIILVWEMYQQYGNKQIIRENFDAMCRYMDYLVETSNDYIRSEKGYSDHNAVSMLDDNIANTAQCAYVALLLSKMSTDIGENDIANKYNLIYNKYKKAWQDNFINSDGSIDCWLQSAYTIGLAFGLYPEELEEKGAQCLNNAIASNDYHLNTGYIATQLLLPVLCDYGYTDTAYKILMQNTAPSWNDMLSGDGTTIAEAWYTSYDTGDGTYAVNGSLNHYALGSVGEWMYAYMLGIKRDENMPGYKHFYLEPIVGGGISFVSGSYESMYGQIKSSWRVDGSEIIFDFTIPANTSATVSLPDAQYRNMELASGSYEYRINVNK